MVDSIIPRCIRTPIVTTPITPLQHQPQPHEVSASLQDSFVMIESIIDAKLQIGSTSSVLDAAVWQAEYACKNIASLLDLKLSEYLSTALKALLKDTENLCTLIGVSYSLDDANAKDILEMAIEVSDDLAVRSGSICTQFHRLFRELEVLS